jgi:hypothetical protein
MENEAFEQPQPERYTLDYGMTINEFHESGKCIDDKIVTKSIA